MNPSTTENQPWLLLGTNDLERRSETLPEPMRDGFVYLGCILRDECNKDVDLLTTRLQALGIAHDKTTWQRILRGRWNRDAEGNETAPLISVEKFLKAVAALKRDQQLRDMAGRVPYIITPTSQEIFDFIDLKAAPDMVCKFGIVIGETGSGKTAAFKEYRLRHNHGTTVLVEAPTALGQFITDLARAYGCPVNQGFQRKKIKIAESVNSRRIIIVDNVQRLYQDRHQGTQPIFDYLHKLQEDSECTIIMSFTPTFEAKFTSGVDKGYFEQFEGRAGGARNFLRLPEYPPEDDVLEIAKAFKLRDAEKHLEALVKIGQERGRIRRIFDDLQRAKRKAEKEGKPLTMQHVRWARGED